MATALKLKNDIKKLKSAINSKATPKSFLPKLKAQLEKAENELASLKSGAKPRKTSTTKGTEKTLSALEKLIQKKKYSVYKGAGVDLKKDAGEGALATGRRVSKGLKANQYGSKGDNKGNVYYEYRPNRLDVKQPKKAQKYPKLEKGGMMDMLKEDDYVWNAAGKKLVVEKVTDAEYYLSGFMQPFGMPFSKDKVHEYIKSGFWSLKPKYADGGMMAKDGQVDNIFSLLNKSNQKETVDKGYLKFEILILPTRDYNKLVTPTLRPYVKDGKTKKIINEGYVLAYVQYVDGEASQAGFKRFDNIQDANNEKIKMTGYSFSSSTSMMAHGGETEDLQHLVGSSINVYQMGVKQPTVETIKSIRVTDKKFSNRDVVLETEGGGVDRFPLSKLDDFLKGEDIKITGGKEPYAIALVEKMAKGGEVKVDDILEASTGVRVKVVDYDPKFGGRVKVRRMDEYDTGEPSQWIPVSKFKRVEGKMMAKGGALSHGLKLGDKIVADQFWENSVVVDNPIRGRAVVYLETGKRVEGGKMAYGGELHKTEA